MHVRKNIFIRMFQDKNAHVHKQVSPKKCWLTLYNKVQLVTII